MGLTPLHDRVLVKPSEPEEITRGGIIIPDTAKEKPQQGVIIAVGKGKVSEEGKVTHIAFKYYYDENGREIDNIYYDAQGSITSQDAKKYNKNGDLIENSLYTSDGTMTGVFRYAYKYDNKNNWIEKIEYWNEYPNTITERKIEYYN